MKNKYYSYVIIIIGVLLIVRSGYSIVQSTSIQHQIKVTQNEIQTIETLKKEKEDEIIKLNEENKLLQQEIANKIEKLKIVYLTFDDGPTLNNTSEILKILKKNNIKATFFVIGQNPEMYKTIVEAGHSIGLHTYSHKYNKVYQSEESFFDDLYKLSDLVYEMTGVRSKITRFPGGSSTTKMKKPLLRKLIDRLTDEGYVYFDWNCDSTDAAANNQPVNVLIENSTKCNIKHINLLMHDSYAKRTTVEALQSIIDYYSKKGYMFDKLTVDSPKAQHRK